jgi:hypothetical protein
MVNSKLGPIPNDHFENEPAPPGVKYPGKWSDEFQAAFDAETERLKELGRKKSGEEGHGMV